MYKCLINPILEEDNYKIIPIREQDIEFIRLWRNAQLDVLRQKTAISQEEQVDYFKKHIWPSFNEDHPKQLLFSFLFEEKCIGYGGLVHIDWEFLRAEVSFLVDPLRIQDPILYSHDFFHYLNLICRIAFEDLHFHRLVTETYAFRITTIQILEKYGFKREGTLRDHVYKRDQWQDSIIHGLLSWEWQELTLTHWQPQYTLETAIPELIEFERKQLKNRPVRTEHNAVLITSISKKMPLINAVRHAADKLGKFQTIHGSDSHSFCIGQYGVDNFWHCPPLKEQNEKDILAYCQTHHINAIIPTRNGDLEFYSRHRKFFYQHNIRIMVSSYETINTCLDKLKFTEVLLKNRFPAIQTYLSADDVNSEALVVKERMGAGSKSLGLNLSHDKALKHARNLDAPIFQEYIEGKEWSVDIYRSFEGHVKGLVARERNVVYNGESQVTTTAHYPELEQLCHAIADHLQIQGHAIFQVIEDQLGHFHVIECNPRFGGASTASVAVGLDSFFWFFIECLGLRLQDYPFIRLENEIRQIRYVTDRVIPWSSFLI